MQGITLFIVLGVICLVELFFLIRLIKKNMELTTEAAVLKIAVENEQLKLKEQIAMKEEISLQFKAVSADILKTQGADLARTQNKELSLILTPLKEQIDGFKKRIEDIQQINVKDKGRFEEQLKQMFSMNLKLSEDAENLAIALKGSTKQQGDWGEIQLERIFEAAGLEKGRDYTAQEVVGDERKRTDFIVYLPEDKRTIVDCKVSLNAYTRFIEAKTDEEKNKALSEHAKAIENHIKNLASKEYQKEIEGLDFVFMFIPIEHAYLEAVRFNPKLHEYAYENKIAFATASSLLPILKVIEKIWQIEKQNKNVQEIASIGGRLYDKIVGFVDDMKKIDQSLDKARVSYDDALKKLSQGKGNALSLTDRLRVQGAKVTKDLSLVIDFDSEEDE